MTSEHKDIPLGDITLRDIAFAEKTTALVVLSIFETVMECVEQDATAAADHLLRRLFLRGDSMKYDPGDEPAMEITQGAK